QTRPGTLNFDGRSTSNIFSRTTPPTIVGLDSRPSGNFDPGRYHSLNRIISYLRKLPIWFLFLSTESQLRMLLPANDKRTGNYASDASTRIRDEDDNPLEHLSTRIRDEDDNPLEHFPPFLAFQLDIEDRRRMQDPEDWQE